VFLVGHSSRRSGQRACGALWTDRGLLQQDGPVAEVYAAYQRFTQFKRMNESLRPWCERSFDLVRPIRSYDPAIAALADTRRVTRIGMRPSPPTGAESRAK
jgi:hypothetical protein